jgi:aspartate/methionine/tyrosine aminotransferase
VSDREHLLARRMDGIAPFHVMAILASARAMEAAGRDIVHMEIGEPDFSSPPTVIAAGREALQNGYTHYTPALGLPELREAIAAYYASRFGIDVPSGRIVVTPGASGALQLVMAALVNPGDEVLMPDPAYPCNRNIAELFGGHVVSLPVQREDGFQIGLEALRAKIGPATRLLMLASPSNPTGTVLGREQLARLHSVYTEGARGYLLCDEIYQGLQYDGAIETALVLNSDRVIVINSFSKYFGMTGWRVGWMVVPETLIEPMERLAQNLFLAAPTPAQHAAVVALQPETRAILEDRRALFQQRRDALYTGLCELGFEIGERPAGAFYLYADAAQHTDDSLAFCVDLLTNAGVAATPGIDFGHFQANRHIRFAYTTAIERLELGLERLRSYLSAGGL